MSLFFGAETKSKEDANALVLGLCWDRSSSFRKGSAKAPKVIREYTSSKIYNSYTENNVNLKDYWKIYDLGDVSPKIVEEGIVNPHNIVQIGTRASTAEQTAYAKNAKIKIVTTSDVCKNAEKISFLINEALGKVDNVYVSFDVDVLDPAFAPGVGNPEGGGITPRNLIDITHNLKGLNVKALDIVEANPDYDCVGVTF
ncbi:arginase family protein, partial [Candidatus Bathyarchaeota archaeon]|nr:arginase family protein [Candidatus Bathyarchaeota archaeon]